MDGARVTAEAKSEGRIGPSPRQRRVWIVQWLLVVLPVTVLLLLPQINARPGMPELSAAMLALWLLGALPTLGWILLYHRSFQIEVREGEVHVHRGVLRRREQRVPLVQVLRTEVRRHLIERWAGVARLVLVLQGGDGSSRQELVLPGLEDPEGARRLLGRAAEPDPEDFAELLKGSIGGRGTRIRQRLAAVQRELDRLRDELEKEERND